MIAEEILNRTEVFLLDLDGTVYLGESPIGGMPHTLARLRALGKRIVFLTNNSSRTEAEYEKKLRRLGLFAGGDGVFTSGTAAKEFLKKNHAGERVYLLGTDALKRNFAAEGIAVCERAPQVCVLAYDTSLTFEKLCVFDEFLRGGAVYYATHPDDVCPTSNGSAPDAGSFLALFEKSSGRRPDRIFGKPFADMARLAAARFHASPKAMCMVGDRMHTDIRFANANGLMSVLVLSGETDAESARRFPDVPDLILPDFNAILGGV